jgi:hypothetical protein
MKRLTMATALLLIATAATPIWAQAPAANDPHHPAPSATPTPAPTQPPSQSNQPGAGGAQGMTGGMPMMINMMSGNMPMMNMMGTMMSMMGMSGPGMGGMATIDRVEGRIAFLRTELKITEAQASAWSAFADALRANAKRLGDMRASMMNLSGAGQQQAATFADRLGLQEQWLVARLEGTRAFKAAFVNLYGVLSDQQKQTASELLAPHMGMMAMMPGWMQPGQMQPGQVMPGPMMRQQAPQAGK